MCVSSVERCPHSELRHNGTVTDQTALARSPALVGQIAVWSITLVLAVLAAIFAPEGFRFTWLALVCSIGVIAAFVRELSTHTQNGFIIRVAVLCTGSFLIVSIVAGVAGLAELLTY
ncbi:hypothetical protein FB385_2705 [Paramicrobacterium agarici]|nr:hypothetical protein FB385_2705 [Microbacterium agarici]